MCIDTKLMCQHWARCCGDLVFISMYLTQAVCLKKNMKEIVMQGARRMVYLTHLIKVFSAI